MAALGDVLFAAAGGLDHLVGGARAAIDEAVYEGDGGVVDDLGGLVGFELAVASVRTDQVLTIGPMGRIGPILFIGPIGPMGPIKVSLISLHGFRITIWGSWCKVLGACVLESS